MGDPFIWLQLASPVAVVATGFAVYWLTARQDRAEARRGR